MQIRKRRVSLWLTGSDAVLLIPKRSVCECGTAPFASAASRQVNRLFGGVRIPWTITNPGPGCDPYWNPSQCVSSDDPHLAK